MPVIARNSNNDHIWQFKGKHKTLNAMYTAMSKVCHMTQGHHGKICYLYFDAIVEHKTPGKVKLVFLHTGKELVVFISSDLSLSGKRSLPPTKSDGISNRVTNISENTLVQKKKRIGFTRH